MSHRLIRLSAAATVLGFASLGAAAGPSAAPSDSPRHVAPAAQSGKIVAIDPIRTRPKGSGVGAVAGGVVGGLIGNKAIGGTAATAIGAVGGAVAGNNLERNHREGVAGYRVHVRLDNGVSRTFDQAHVGDLRVGDRVRVQNGRLQRY